MHLLATIRRCQPPLICLAIACVVAAGCHSKQETLYLGQPLQAYRAGNGAVLFGYYVEPMIKPEYTGWHWLIVEPDTAELLLQPASSPGSPDSVDRAVAVSYIGWRTNARLVPPLVDPGRADSAPPVIGDGGLTALRFVWDETMQGVRLLDAGGSALALMRVTPQFATLKIYPYQREFWLGVLRVLMVAGVITGLILLGGSAEVNVN